MAANQRLNMGGYATYEAFLRALVQRLRDGFGDGRILACAVFGSVARGEAGPESDVDLLVVHDGMQPRPLERFVDLLPAIRASEEFRALKARGLNPEPYPIFMTEKELWEHPLILLDVLDHGIVLHDSGALRRRLEALRKRLSELGSRKVELGDGGWYWDLKPDWKPGEVVEL